MFKKFVSLAVGTACLFSMVGVSATMTVTTSTAYQASDIKVTTTVAGTEEEMNGTTLTYLAHDAEGITDGSNIVYVDQIIADATSEKFEYVTQYSKIGSTVKVGGRTSAGTAIAPTLESEITGVPVKIGETAINATFTVFADEDLTATDLVKITATELNDIAGIAALTVNGGTEVASGDYFAGSDCIWVKYGVLNSVAADGALEITLDTTADAKVQTASLGYKLNESTEDGPSAIAIGYVAGNVDEYGIVFSSDATISANALTAYEGVTEAGVDVAFPALGKGTDGLYAVEVYNVDEFAGTLGEDIYAAAYIKIGETYTIGKIFKVATSGNGSASLASIEPEEVDIEEAIIYDVIEEDDEIEFIEIEDVIEIEEIEEIEEVDEVDEIDIVE